MYIVPKSELVDGHDRRARRFSRNTEYLVDPLSIDTRIPRLSWIIDAGTARGVSQSKYQIEVASTPANLAADKADWSAQWIGDPLPSVDNVAAALLGDGWYAGGIGLAQAVTA